MRSHRDESILELRKLALLFLFDPERFHGTFQVSRAVPQRSRCFAQS
jgi:hypothetical protein